MKPSLRLVRLLWLGLLVSLMPLVLAPLWPLVLVVWGVLALGSLMDVRVLSTSFGSLEATPPKQAYVGEPVALQVDLAWATRRELSSSWLVEVDEPLEASAPAVRKLQPERSIFSLEVAAPRRGQGDLLALWVEVTGPLGLFHRVKRFPLELKPLPILPSIPLVRRLALEHFGLWQYREGLRIERLPGDGSEFDTLESYAPGHDLRSVDWKASARHQQLMVRRFRVERNQRLVLCLDTGHLMSDDLQGLQRLDHAIHASLLLSNFALRAGDQVGLHAYADAPQSWLPPKGGIRNFHRMNLACAGLTPRDIETNHVRGLHHLLSQLRRRTLIVLFSEFTSTTTAELMLETIGHLVRKHLVIFVALEDPVLGEPLKQSPLEMEMLARVVVASQMQQERQSVLLRLRRMGVHVVEGTVEQSPVRLVQRYLEIKRRALIG